MRISPRKAERKISVMFDIFGLERHMCVLFGYEGGNHGKDCFKRLFYIFIYFFLYRPFYISIYISIQLMELSECIVIFRI